MKSVNGVHPLVTILIVTVVVGVLGALAFAPAAALSGAALKRTNETMQSNLADMSSGVTPGITTVTDVTGDPIAYLYNQRRHPVEGDAISQNMKDAIIAIEDHRFYEHNGVDIQGTARALLTNLAAGGVAQGASTINQQYVKNYLLHVEADSTEEQQAATEQSIPRKLREMRTATELDRTMSKDEILTRYLNLVPFGNHAYGIEAAAHTYFGVSAAELDVPQSAMLAGMVQSSEYLNPFTNYDAVLERRNTVLQSMVNFGYLDQAQADAYKAEGLNTLESPALIPNGCIGADERGFFCDYAMTYAKSKGLTDEQLKNDAYTIRTTLDPAVQDASHAIVTTKTSPTAQGVAEVMNVVEPGQDSRNILAMVSSRDYGLDLEAGQTYLPQPTSMVGNGAGSVFKIFTAAAALQQGMGLDTVLPVPTRYEARGLGSGGARNCPPATYCVENAGTYKPEMTLAEALALSPNTTFIMLIEEVGVPAVVDLSVKLGLRSYAVEGSYNEDYSIADYFKEANLGSYTLGPTAVNPLELSNVGATLASHGRWCEPNPIAEITDRNGNEVFLDRPECEQVLEPAVADALADAMTLDAKIGTAQRAAEQAGFSGQAAAKTGTTESHQSSAFLGFNSGFAAAPYIYNDGTTTTPLCTSPVRQCGDGSLFGGREPAETFYELASRVPAAAAGTVAAAPAEYRQGTAAGTFEQAIGLSESAARTLLQEQGYTVAETRRGPGGGLPAGVVARVSPRPGGDRSVVLILSDGQNYNPPAAPAQPTASAPPAPPQEPEPAPSPAQPDPVAELERQLNDAAREFLNSL
ncbi:penicillin-binding protein [Corynebacterium guangdongense]|uniref:Membrane peptidoglycan carboxypeptidase n=1 Tax=Corynebacterium guangdongense TaxID=1783348 RepID=A0ABU2A0U3_9CORY|nr:penicillin-binding protein [Corynebacterium guangdongense]MDR7330803.1 membrane peptidoglycan carboxypeptidase [Corynebacterium guangdongense]WJZ16818.1 Penicillin-binding protein 1F [Corynebacterium guangdongense]